MNRKCIAVIEDEITVKPSGYQHVFSTRPNPADSFPEDYLMVADLRETYNYVFVELDKWYQRGHLKNTFTYRGVDLLQCLRKPIFEYLFAIEVRQKLLLRLFDTFPSDELCFQVGVDLDYPYLSQVVPGSIISSSRRISYVDFHLKNITSPLITPPHRGSRFLPEIVTYGRIDAARVVVCADLAKTLNEIKALAQEDRLLYLQGFAPRIWLRALKEGLSIYQTNFSRGANSRLKKDSEELSSHLDNLQSFNISLLDNHHLETLLKEKLTWLFNCCLTRYLFEIEQAHRFFQTAKSLKSLLVDEDISFSKNALCQVARQHGVSSFVTVHGALGQKTGFVPLTADKILVWGESQKQTLMAWGCPSQQIYVTGASRFRPYQEASEEQLRLKICRKYGLDPNKKLILFGFHPVKPRHDLFHNERNKMNLAYLQSLENRGETEQFIIKIHPGDPNRSLYNSWLERKPKSCRAIIIENENSLRLIKAVDILVVLRSTLAIEGFALEKPVIVIDQDNHYNAYEEYRPYNIFTYVRNPQELHAALDQIIEGKKLQMIQNSERARRECFSEGCEDPAFVIATILREGGNNLLKSETAKRH